MSEREGASASARVAPAAAMGQMEPPSPAMSSSERPVVSGLGLSGGFSSSSSRQGSSGEAAPPAAAEGGRRVHDRLEWVVPKMSRKAKWRRRKSLRRQQGRGSPVARPVSPSMAGRCFKCLKPGHPKRECWFEQVCYRCGEEGHGSGGCKRPRSPDSEEELRCRAIALVDRRLAGRRGNTPPGGRDRGAPAAQQPGAPGRRTPAVRVVQGPSPPAAPAPPPPPELEASVGSGGVESRVRPGVETPRVWAPCVVRRSQGLEDMERRLECALVAYVGGSRPHVSREQVEDALVLRAGVPRGAFTVHRFKPEDFLIVFAAPEFLERVARRPSLPFAFFTLFFRQWTRQAQASHVAMRSRVSLAVEGVPAHAWDKEVVQQLVGDSCALDALAPETACRSDLGFFRVEAWTSDPEGIPPRRELWVPEPQRSSEASSSSRPARRDLELGLLKYDVLIHVSRIEEFVRIEAPEDGSSSAPDRRHGRRPDREASGGAGAGEGFWTSRTLRWVPGVPDCRGGGAAGSQGGGAGRAVAWRLPHLEPQGAVPQEDRCVRGDGRVGVQEMAESVAFGRGQADLVGSVRHPPGPILRGGLGIGAAVSGSGDQCLDPFKLRETGLDVEAVGEIAGDVEASQPCLQVDGAKTASSPGAEASGSEGQARASLDDRSPLIGQVDEEAEQFVRISLSGGQGVTFPPVFGATVPRKDGPGSDEGLLPQQQCSVNGSVGPVDSFIGPDENMRGVVMDSVAKERMAAQEAAALGRMRRFCALILKKLAPPLLREIESAEAMRKDLALDTPRRVTRAAVAAPALTPGPRRTGKASAAELALLKALGIKNAGLEASEEAVAEFRKLFDSPVQERHIRVMAAIFGKTMPEDLGAGMDRGIAVLAQ
ncbi:hypothetical protein QYE76_033079 [Lolium multiflorum]|uniref:CCHC-type domain-containing protein n=1 Tax=Lolium multiflorum TaxID=4521 RepID=A0AAD8QUZ2_LOLMU|nr:hypothetical protein QYE76_033079 [Lolium multiflorum]